METAVNQDLFCQQNSEVGWMLSSVWGRIKDGVFCEPK